MTREEVIALLRKRVGKGFGRKRKWALENGVDQAALCNILNGKYCSSVEIPPRILDALGLKRVISFEPKEG